MSLRGSCVICTDYFDSENDISVTPCGHLFHALCLNQWIETSPKRTCPQCRMSITSKRIIAKIFINTPEEDQESLDPFALKNKLDELDGLLRKGNSEKSDLQSSLKAMENAKDKLMSKVKKLRCEITSSENTIHLLKSDVDTLKTELSYTKALKEETKQLKHRLKTLEKVEICLNGQKTDVDEMMAQYSQSSSSKEAKQLATFCVAMKQEYETLKESRNKLNHDNMKLKRELHKSNERLVGKSATVGDLEKIVCNLQQSEESLQKENQSLQQKIKKLQLAISSPTDTRTSAINRLICESPAPEFLTPINGIPVKKTKQVQSTSNNFFAKKPCLSSSFDNTEIDLNESFENKFSDKIPFFVPDTPDQEKAKLKKDCLAQKENLVNENVTVKRQNETKPNFVNPLSIRQKLLTNKLAAGRPIGYDGLGGHKKLSLQKTSSNIASSSNKFSSSHNSAFKDAAAKKLLSNQNRFSRLKRTLPS